MRVLSPKLATRRGVGYGKIWKLFKETDRKFKETDRKFKETEKEFKEIAERFKETDRQFKETDKKFKETERLLNERFKETDLMIKQTQKAIGELGNRLGQFVEEMVKPAVVKLFQGRGLDVCRVMSDLVAKYGEEGIQVDLVVINGSEAIVVECKSKLTVDDVNEHIERMGKFKRYWPEYGGVRLYGAVAGMVVPDDVAKYAYRQGFYVLAQKGDMVEIRNDEKFQPKEW